MARVTCPPGRIFSRSARVASSPIPGVDDRVSDPPQVDVVELKRQRHADPAHAGSHLERAARRGRVGKGVLREDIPLKFLATYHVDRGNGAQRGFEQRTCPRSPQSRAPESAPPKTRGD